MKKRVFSALAVLLLSASVLCGCNKQTGWVELDGRVCYYLEDGTAATGWLNISGKQYYFGADGVMKRGLQEVDGAMYYLSEDGSKVSGWVDVDGVMHYFPEDGAKASGWMELDGQLYYLRQNGSVVTGWLSLDGQRYYLSDSGAVTGIRQIQDNTYLFDHQGRLTSGWVELDGGRVYGDMNGHPVTGWQTINGERYYFRDDYFLQTGWAEIDGFTYCFHPDGRPYQGITPEGEFASNGQLVPLVNPWHYLRDDYSVELTAFKTIINETHYVAALAYQDYLDMIRDCTNAGYQPVVCSSYRSLEYQQGLFDNKVQRLLDKYGKKKYTMEEIQEMAAQSVAIPGTSEHQLGLALDIVDDRYWYLDEKQAQMPTQKWLMENSWRYGWILRYPVNKSNITGIIYEPWHYRYVGKEVAAEIYQLDICLEEYLQLLTAGNG